MAGHDVFPNGWAQLSFVQPEVVEARLRVGIVAGVDHAQIQFEMDDPSTKVLLALESKPHCRIGQLEAQLDMYYARMKQQLLDWVRASEPFPDPPGGDQQPL